MAKTGYSNNGICSRCKVKKDLRILRPRWCVECYRAYQKQYHAENKERIQIQKRIGNRKYNKTAKGKINHKNGKYRRKSKVIGRIKLKEWRALCTAYNHKCVRCGLEKELTIDHIKPLSKGGLNKIENIQPLCMDCNVWKHTKEIDYRY